MISMTKLYELRRIWAIELDSRTQEYHRNLRYPWISYVMKRKNYKSFQTVVKDRICGRALGVYARLMRLEWAKEEADSKVEAEINGVYWGDE